MDCISVVNLDGVRKNIDILKGNLDSFSGSISKGFTVKSNKPLRDFHIDIKDMKGNTQTRWFNCKPYERDIKILKAPVYAFPIDEKTSIIFDMDPDEIITIIFDIYRGL